MAGAIVPTLFCLLPPPPTRFRPSQRSFARGAGVVLSASPRRGDQGVLDLMTPPQLSGPPPGDDLRTMLMLRGRLTDGVDESTIPSLVLGGRSDALLPEDWCHGV